MATTEQERPELKQIEDEKIIEMERSFDIQTIAIKLINRARAKKQPPTSSIEAALIASGDINEDEIREKVREGQVFIDQILDVFTQLSGPKFDRISDRARQVAQVNPEIKKLIRGRILLDGDLSYDLTALDALRKKTFGGKVLLKAIGSFFLESQTLKRKKRISVAQLADRYYAKLMMPHIEANSEANAALTEAVKKIDRFKSEVRICINNEDNDQSSSDTIDRICHAIIKKLNDSRFDDITIDNLDEITEALHSGKQPDKSELKEIFAYAGYFKSEALQMLKSGKLGS